MSRTYNHRRNKSRSHWYDDIEIRISNCQIRAKYRDRLKSFEGLDQFEDTEWIDIQAVEKKKFWDHC